MRLSALFSYFINGLFPRKQIYNDITSIFHAVIPAGDFGDFAVHYQFFFMGFDERMNVRGKVFLDSPYFLAVLGIDGIGRIAIIVKIFERKDFARIGIFQISLGLSP